MKTLIEILTGDLQYSSSWGVWAKQDEEGAWSPDSPARFGQHQFENGGVRDGFAYFGNNEWIQDRLDSLTGYTDGTEEEREAIGEAEIREAAESLIEEMNG